MLNRYRLEPMRSTIRTMIFYIFILPSTSEVRLMPIHLPKRFMLLMNLSIRWRCVFVWVSSSSSSSYLYLSFAVSNLQCSNGLFFSYQLAIVIWNPHPDQLDANNSLLTYTVYITSVHWRSLQDRYSITYNTCVRRELSDWIFYLSTPAPTSLPPSLNAPFFNNYVRFMFITWLARCQLVHQLNCNYKTKNHRF